ncbi:hypothetical protein C8J57DRAFT_1529203 [Mycena rebaudengoi]|nr:hypothetical protein C8J57DRAFT_1529203 [Mycena rebaudengoi]
MAALPPHLLQRVVLSSSPTFLSSSSSTSVYLPSCLDRNPSVAPSSFISCICVCRFNGMSSIFPWSAFFSPPLTLPSHT